MLSDHSQFSVPEQPDEDAKPKLPPIFVSKPEPVTVEEGEWARFCARVTGHPRPRVMWLINGHTVVNVSKQGSVLEQKKRKFSKDYVSTIFIENCMQ